MTAHNDLQALASAAAGTGTRPRPSSLKATAGKRAVRKVSRHPKPPTLTEAAMGVVGILLICVGIFGSVIAVVYLRGTEVLPFIIFSGVHCTAAGFLFLAIGHILRYLRQIASASAA